MFGSQLYLHKLGRVFDNWMLNGMLLQMVATICMFIAGKVEETPRSLRDVILVSYENRFKKDPAAVHRIKQKVIYQCTDLPFCELSTVSKASTNFYHGHCGP